MAKHYEDHFRQLIKDQSWSVTKFVFATELIFVIDKRASLLAQHLG
jgi:hypothetical protein